MILKIAMNKSHPGSGIWRIEKPDGTFIFVDDLDIIVPVKTAHRKSIGDNNYNGWIEADGIISLFDRKAVIS